MIFLSFAILLNFISVYSKAEWTLQFMNNTMLRDRDDSSLSAICALLCTHKCLHGSDMINQYTCGERCSETYRMLRNFTSTRDKHLDFDRNQNPCENVLCVPGDCLTSLLSFGNRDARNSSSFGVVGSSESACFIHITWRTSRNIGQTFILEEYVNRSWSLNEMNSMETKTVSVLKDGIHRIFRLAAVDESGLIVTSPEIMISRNTSGWDLLPVTNLTLTEVVRTSPSLNRFTAVLIWKLPEGLRDMDVNSYRVEHLTTYCDVGSSPAVSLSPNGTEAKITNIRLDCSYHFNVSYDTVCGQSSPSTSVDVVICCSIISDALCNNGAKENDLGSTGDSISIISINVSVFWNENNDICANASWENPEKTHSSNATTGFEIWWGPVWRPMDSVSWFYELEENYSRATLSDEHNYFVACGLLFDRKYGLKVATLGRIPYNVSSILQYQSVHLFDTNEAVQVETMAEATEVFLSVGLPIFAVVILIGASLAFIRHRKHKLDHGFEKRPFLPHEPLILRYKISERRVDLKSTERTKTLLPPLVGDRWEIPRSRIILGETVGKGAFGVVFKAVIKGTVLVSTSPGNSLKRNAEKYSDFVVAVKLLPGQFSGQAERESFLCEIEMMKAIGYHKNVVSLIGSCLNTESLCLIEEYCPLGDLQQYLTKKRTEAGCTVDNQQYFNGGGHSDFHEVPITLRVLLSYARQIAVAMEYLHERGYLHRDLAARNVMLADETLVKVGDFGLSRRIEADSTYTMTNPGKLPVKWMAIESISDLIFSTASDVWAFGIVLFEITTLGGSPYPDLPNQNILVELKKGHRMDCPESCPPEVYALMLRCWSAEARLRPSFTEVVTETEGLLEKASQNEAYLQLDFSKDYYVAVAEEDGEKDECI